MTETQTPQTATPEAPEVSRNRKIAAVVLSTATTVALTIATNVAIGVASAKVTDLIVTKKSKTNEQA